MEIIITCIIVTINNYIRNKWQFKELTNDTRNILIMGTTYPMREKFGSN